jgi:hypothetical protein
MSDQIETAEELDALPPKSVLLDRDGWVVQRTLLFGWQALNGTRDIDNNDLLRDGAPFAVLHRPDRPRDPAPERVTDHDYLPVAGHPDDDECTYRNDGTDLTYCGEPQSAHGAPEREGEGRAETCPSCGAPDRFAVRPPCSLDQYDPDAWHSWGPSRPAAEHHPAPTPDLMGEPTQTCTTCGDVEIVRMDGRGFPPDIAKRRLAKRCAAKGHTCAAVYRAGLTVGPRPHGMEVTR